MTVRPAVVVLGWLAANVVLIAVLFGFGEGLVGELVYLCSSLPILGFALAVGWGTRGEEGAPDYLTLPPGTGYCAAAAVGSLIFGLGFVYATWISIVGGLVTAWALLQIWRARPEASVLDESHD